MTIPRFAHFSLTPRLSTVLSRPPLHSVPIVVGDPGSPNIRAIYDAVTDTITTRELHDQLAMKRVLWHEALHAIAFWTEDVTLRHLLQKHLYVNALSQVVSSFSFAMGQGTQHGSRIPIGGVNVLGSFIPFTSDASSVIQARAGPDGIDWETDFEYDSLNYRVRVSDPRRPVEATSNSLWRTIVHAVNDLLGLELSEEEVHAVAATFLTTSFK